MKDFGKYLAGALVVVIAFGLGVAVMRTQGGEGLAGVKQTPDSYPNGVIFGKQTPVTENWVRKQIVAGNNEDSWLNDTGREVFVDTYWARNTSVATSSVTLDVATSSSATVSNDFADFNGTLIDGRQIATSTPANTVITNQANALARRERIRVAAGEYLVTHFRAPANCVSGLATTAGAPGKCAAATSTIIGNLDYAFRYTFTQ